MTTNSILPGWVIEAARMPVAFAQVREDSLLDLALLDRIGGQQIRGITIASGGCTAAALVASGRLAHLHLVDINPAQIALCRLKLHLLQTAAPQERLQLLGHALMESRTSALSELLATLSLASDALGPPGIVAELGPDHAGRYELLFARFRWEMREFANAWPAVLELPDASSRGARVAPATPLGFSMDQAFERVMNLSHLVQLFGAEATQNSIEPFSRHFARRTRHAIAALPTAANPYLWQLLTGRFPDRVVHPWLTAAPPERMPDIVMSIGMFEDVLIAFRGEFDFVHLSNILDWLSPDQARRTLELTRAALRPGGYAFIRQLNSALDLPELAPAFDWLVDEAQRLHAHDRSFFYRRLHLGRKR